MYNNGECYDTSDKKYALLTIQELLVIFSFYVSNSNSNFHLKISVFVQVCPKNINVSVYNKCQTFTHTMHASEQSYVEQREERILETRPTNIRRIQILNVTFTVRHVQIKRGDFEFSHDSTIKFSSPENFPRPR